MHGSSSNPIYVRPGGRCPPPLSVEVGLWRIRPAGGAGRLRRLRRARLDRGWRLHGRWQRDRFTWRLGDGAPHGQYARWPYRWRQRTSRASTRSNSGCRPGPMRLSVQLRVPQGTDLRWERSVYLDATLRSHRPTRRTAAGCRRSKQQRVDLARVDTLLLVVDTVNATPGSAGSAGWVRWPWLDRLAEWRLRYGRSRASRPLLRRRSDWVPRRRAQASTCLRSRWRQMR